jgi:predicted AlkP superfamily pyrophosphatase or phosphodiesterase
MTGLRTYGRRDAANQSMKPFRIACMIVVATATVVAGVQFAQTQAPDARHVVVISIDGLKPSTYTAAGPSKVPTLRRLAKEGAYADGVVGVTPTVTYPSHTTMITGVPPAVHGIYNNRILDAEETSNASWYWYARNIQVPTLYSAAKARGLRTAAVSWPVTVGADIDYLMPEFGGVTRHAQWLDLIRGISNPRDLLDSYERQVKPLSWPLTDDDRTGVAAWIIRTYRPHLMLLHIFGTDDAQHRFGPGTPEALAAIETADGHVQQIIDAVNAAGLADRTDIVVLSDHGFLPLQNQLNPNNLFKREGLIQVDAAGKIAQWDAYFYPAGGSGYVILKDRNDAALRERVGKLLQGLAADPANGVLTVWSEDELRKAGAEPRASFGIDMKDGFYSGSSHETLLTKPTSKGGHGFAPTRTDLHASLIMRGPDVGKPRSLGTVRMSQIGPTIASWLKLSLSPKADAVLPLTRDTAAAPAR